MSQARRRQWLAWAQRRGGLLIEYDLYGGLRSETPAPSLWRMSARSASAVHVGSLSRTLSPTLQVDYLVFSASLSLRRSLLQHVNEPPSPIVQDVLCQLLDEGHVTRYTRRMMPVYRQKRDLVRRVLGDLGTVGQSACTEFGTHAVLTLPRAVSCRTVAAELRRHGVLVRTLSSFTSGAAAPSDGLVIGYTHLPVPELERGLTLIAGVVRSVSRCSA
ncbi:hypothetical protein [Streptomyces sp. NPDC127084]|uniref:hypothetical protein n=1 Tax=Streptomyces sp. NPDC127084 TaxID=3347133 RepID=UPI0036581E4A